MPDIRLCSVVLIGVAALTAIPSYAQQTSEAAKTLAAQPPSQAAQSTAQTADSASSDNADASSTAALIAKANAAAATAGKSSAKPAADNAAVAKKAKQAGWRPEVQNGDTVYCRSDAQVGSRFSTRRCVNETQLALLIEQAEYDKDQLKQRGCGGNCGESGH